MSLTNMDNNFFNLSLDGLNVVDADQIYINGELVDLSSYVLNTTYNIAISDLSSDIQDLSATFIAIDGSFNLYLNDLSSHVWDLVQIDASFNNYVLDLSSNIQLLQNQDVSQNYLITDLSSHIQDLITIDNLLTNYASDLSNNLYNNYYTKTQSDNNYLPKSTDIIPYIPTNSSLYQFTVRNKAFITGSQTYDIEITDAGNITTAMRFGAGNIDTSGYLFNGLSRTKYTLLSDLSSSPQQQINNLSININDLSNNLKDLSNNLYDLSSNLSIRINNLSNNLQDLSNNLSIRINDLSNNLYDLSNNLSIRINNLSNNLQDLSNNLSIRINDLSNNLNSNYYTKTDSDLKFVDFKTDQDIYSLKTFYNGIVSWTGITSNFSNVGATLKLKNLISGYLFQPVLSSYGNYDSSGTGYYALESYLEKGNQINPGVLYLNPGYQYPVWCWGHLLIKNKNIYLDDGQSIFIGPNENNACRFHHISNNDSYLDYGARDLYIRNNNNGAITQAAYLNQSGQWIIATSGGQALDRFNIVGGLSLQNTSAYNSSNKITFVHNYNAGFGECQNYTWLSGNQAAISWRWSPSGVNPSNYENILTLYDDVAGSRQIVTKAQFYIQKENFELQYINRVNGGDGFGAASIYQISGVDQFRIFGGRIDTTQGYWAMDLRYNSAMTGGNNYYDSLIYSTYGTTNLKQNLTITKDLTINNTGEATFYMKANNFGPSSWALQTSVGNNYLYFWRYDTNWSQQAAIKDNGEYYEISDEREKKDIKTLDTVKSLFKILNSRTVNYLMKNDKEDKSRNIGLIAQEQQKINPYCVQEMSGTIKHKETKYKTQIDEEGKEIKIEYEEETEVKDEKLMICYKDYIIHLIGGMQEQQKQINSLKEELSSLKKTIVDMNDTLINVINYIKK